MRFHTIIESREREKPGKLSLARPVSGACTVYLHLVLGLIILIRMLLFLLNLSWEDIIYLGVHGVMHGFINLKIC